jgi:hypothetical protein
MGKPLQEMQSGHPWPLNSKLLVFAWKAIVFQIDLVSEG